MNVDGAVVLSAGLHGLGTVLRNEKGNYCFAVSKWMCGLFSPKATEFYAAAMGFQVLFHAGFILRALF